MSVSAPGKPGNLALLGLVLTRWAVVRLLRLVREELVPCVLFIETSDEVNMAASPEYPKIPWLSEFRSENKMGRSTS